MIRLVLNLYVYILIADAILSYFPNIRHQEWVRFIKRLADFTLNPIRRYLPQDLPFDVSPIIVIILLQLLKLLW